MRGARAAPSQGGRTVEVALERRVAVPPSFQGTLAELKEMSDKLDAAKVSECGAASWGLTVPVRRRNSAKAVPPAVNSDESRPHRRARISKLRTQTGPATRQRRQQRPAPPRPEWCMTRVGRWYGPRDAEAARYPPPRHCGLPLCQRRWPSGPHFRVLFPLFSLATPWLPRLWGTVHEASTQQPWSGSYPDLRLASARETGS